MAFCLPMGLIPLCYPTPPTPKTGFQNLPAEIKLVIIRHLRRDTLTLSRVAACNRELYNMAMPELYADVSLGSFPHYRIWPGVAWPADRRSIELFLLTILRKPHLARLVKSLDLTDLHELSYSHRLSSTHPERRQLNLQPLLSRDHKIIMDACMQLPLYSTVRVAMYKALEPNVPRSDALLAVLLGYLPALERLEIPMESEDPLSTPVADWSLVERVLVSIAGARSMYTDENGISRMLPPTLSKLTRLKVEVDANTPSADVDWLTVLLRIPTLTHVFGTKWTNAGRWIRPVPGYSSLVHLELRDCTFDALNFRRLLKQTHKLQTFIYQRGWTIYRDWVLKASDLSQALQYTSQTLTCLELSFNRSGRKIYEDLYLQPLNLSGLVHLKRLRTSAGYLVQTEGKMEYFEGRFWRLYDEEGSYNSLQPLHQLLPKSLEQLHIFQIHDCFEFTLVRDKLCESLQSRTVPLSPEPHQFERLKEIIIEAPFEDKGVHLFEKLFNITNQVGVKLTTIENSAEYVRSWINTASPSRVSCADKNMDWGFDGEIQWEHPFIQRGELEFCLR